MKYNWIFSSGLSLSSIISVRLWIAKDRKKFVKTHIFDLIALIPLDSLFRFFRFFRVFRLSIYVYRYTKAFFKVLHTNGLSKVLALTLVTVVAGATVIEVIVLIRYMESLAEYKREHLKENNQSGGMLLDEQPKRT